MAKAYLSLGSNLGDRRAHLEYALTSLATYGRLLARSPFYETAPINCDGGKFLNACACFETTLEPVELMAEIMRIEKDHGRQRQKRNASRVIDIDLLLFDARIISEENLTLPHPRMHSRRFVLEPLATIAANTVHPVLGTTISELLLRLPVTNPDLSVIEEPGRGSRRVF